MSVIVGVTDRKSGLPYQRELEEFGYCVKVAHSCTATLDAIERGRSGGIEAVIIDSELIAAGRLDPRAPRPINMVQEIRRRRTPDCPILVFMTKPLKKITDKNIRREVQRGDSIVYWPASPSDVHLSLRALKAYW